MDMLSDLGLMGLFGGLNQTGNISADQILAHFNNPGNGSEYLTPQQIENLLAEPNMGFNYDTITQVALITAFGLLIMFGAAGNGLVCYVVAMNPHMRTPRNIFIINLAISDLTLCLFTQPFNLIKILMNEWKLGAFMCKLIPMCAGTNVFVSTISITAIAMDRFQVIVYPTKDSMKKVGAAMALLSIWVISLLMASPLLIFNVQHDVSFDNVVLFTGCWENPDLHYEKGAYSIASMIFQYIVPILIVVVAHARICTKLRYRMIRQQARQQTAISPFQKRKNEMEAKRKRKTNLLLIFIGIVFACSWMPLNVFNIMADFNPTLLNKLDSHGLVFPICHLLVLSSACTNPVLYGWLNDNFRKEFVALLCVPCCKNIRVVCDCKNTCKRLLSCCCCRCAQGSKGHKKDSPVVVVYTKASNGVNNQTVDTEVTAAGLSTPDFPRSHQTNSVANLVVSDA